MIRLSVCGHKFTRRELQNAISNTTQDKIFQSEFDPCGRISLKCLEQECYHFLTEDDLRLIYTDRKYLMTKEDEVRLPLGVGSRSKKQAEVRNKMCVICRKTEREMF